MAIAIIPEFAIRFVHRLAVCGLGLFFGIKDTDMDAINSSIPAAVSYAQSFGKFASSPASLIVRILRNSSPTEIAPSVIGWIIINVINQTRLFAGLKFPDNAMHLVEFAGESDGDARLGAISGDVQVVNRGASESYIPGFIGAIGAKVVAWAVIPRQGAGFWVVRKALAQKLDIWQIVCSHCVLSSGSVVRDDACPGKGRVIPLFKRIIASFQCERAPA